jgi:NAD(P)-dependent dehydrogenase (short-subunit alcohol dehydrogenase family)
VVVKDPESGLQGACVIVTGASSGIGLAMLRLFAGRGSRVVAVDIARDRLAELKAEGEWTPVVADVAQASGASAIVEAALKAYGTPRALLNNAGILDRLLQVDETPEEIFDRVMAVNLKGPFLLSKQVLPLMREAGEGVIVNTASIAGLRGGRAGAAYTVSKHGVVGLTKSIAAAYGEFGIRCVAIAPGAVNTNIPHGGEDSELGRVLGGRAAASRVGRKAEPEEIAEIAYFLASPAASALNGSVVLGDRGWLAL